MGIMDWFRQAAGGKASEANAAPEVAPANESRGAEVGGLNFKSAVDAHMKWKIRLESYINGSSQEDLEVDVVSRDDQCPLGKWIYSRGGSEFGYAETFFDMKVHHANFHRCAGEVLRTAQAGDKKKALQLLHHGDYVRASERVKQLLARLFVLVVDGKTAIDAHLKWKERLHDYIAGKEGNDLDPSSVGRDDLCTLGAWINGDGARAHGSKPGFAALRETHTRFHASAAKVLELAKLGRRDEALTMLEDGEYAQASDAVTAALVDLFAQQA